MTNCRALIAVFMIFISGCVSSPDRAAIDQLPEYGGLDRASVPELKAADEWFIENTTQKYGSREVASKVWSERGMECYFQDDLATAMKRFNQAWLLDPENYEAYWGFGAVMSDRGKYAEAIQWLEKAYSKKQDVKDLNADLAFIYSAAGAAAAYTAGARDDYFIKSLELFRKFEATNQKAPYLYFMWGRALAVQGQDIQALEKLQVYKQLGGKRDVAELESRLRQRVASKK
jgi:tetratricopeptide (TPR) repeat protein